MPQGREFRIPIQTPNAAAHDGAIFDNDLAFAPDIARDASLDDLPTGSRSVIG
jgi:hypothetical protein